LFPSYKQEGGAKKQKPFHSVKKKERKKKTNETCILKNGKTGQRTKEKQIDYIEKKKGLPLPRRATPSACKKKKSKGMKKKLRFAGEGTPRPIVRYRKRRGKKTVSYELDVTNAKKTKTSRNAGKRILPDGLTKQAGREGEKDQSKTSACWIQKNGVIQVHVEESGEGRAGGAQAATVNLSRRKKKEARRSITKEVTPQRGEEADFSDKLGGKKKKKKVNVPFPKHKSQEKNGGKQGRQERFVGRGAR